MASTRRSPRRRGRSALAAAFLSLLIPGLGHAYLGYWLRAAAWLFLPVVGVCVVAAILVAPGRTDTLASLADPDMLLVALGFVLWTLRPPRRAGTWAGIASCVALTARWWEWWSAGGIRRGARRGSQPLRDL